ncbi:FABP family protein [Tessaracoccus flavus]|uniref:Fatty acid-binding-like protein n=1 Tax=Tessaracoccus flavus TaxID=1610493 RepID=A0A1Q2CBG7_9ACTN|nr:FABP family protein [Tessaracoccus flavus]AQP43450.1 fatty acid-binding-like protein [Tessaracoccus flavus]SDY83804.1 protein of unknown function [Tessaracoccus flavus]
MHVNLLPAAALAGTYVGLGRGEYPTIEGFEYREELTFADVGKPFLQYVQRTWSADGERPMHTESGYLRIGEGGHIEMTIAQPMGQTESCEGTLTVEDGVLTLTLNAKVTNTTTAKVVHATKRTYHLVGDQLATTFDMEAVGEEMGRHLTSTLKRVATR